jgi:hypothetical protein
MQSSKKIPNLYLILLLHSCSEVAEIKKGDLHPLNHFKPIKELKNYLTRPYMKIKKASTQVCCM